MSKGVHVYQGKVILSPEGNVQLLDEDDSACLCGSPCPWQAFRCYDHQPAHLWLADDFVQSAGSILSHDIPIQFTYGGNGALDRGGVCFYIDSTSERGEPPDTDKVLSVDEMNAVLADGLLGGCGFSPCGCTNCDGDDSRCYLVTVAGFTLPNRWVDHITVGMDTSTEAVEVTGGINGSVYVTREGFGRCVWRGKLTDPVVFKHYLLNEDGSNANLISTYTRTEVVLERHVSGYWIVTVPGATEFPITSDTCDEEASSEAHETPEEEVFFSSVPRVGGWVIDSGVTFVEGTITVSSAEDNRCECPNDTDSNGNLGRGDYVVFEPSIGDPDGSGPDYGLLPYPGALCFLTNHPDGVDNLFGVGVFSAFRRPGDVWDDGQYVDLHCTSNGDGNRIWRLTINTSSHGHDGDGVAVWEVPADVDGAGGALHTHIPWALVTWTPNVFGTKPPTLTGIGDENCCPVICFGCCQQVTVTPTHSEAGSSFDGIPYVLNMNLVVDCQYVQVGDPGGTLLCDTRLGAGPEKRWRITLTSHLHAADGTVIYELNQGGTAMSGCPNYMTGPWTVSQWTPDTPLTPQPDDLVDANVVWGACPP